MYDNDNRADSSRATPDESAPLDRLHAALAALSAVSADELLVEAAHAASRILADGCTVIAADDSANLPAGAWESVSVGAQTPATSYGRLILTMNDGVGPSRLDQTVVQTIAQHVGVLADNQRLLADVVALQEKIANLQIALNSNRQIGAAIGILMHRYKVDYDAGFELLRDASQHTQTKLREVAEGVLRTGDLPDGGLKR
jgi:ribosomal protein L12E/L44/L45/RPP1/RPP2